MSDHGTYERSQQHYRDEGKGWVCEPCREARNAYAREHRTSIEAQRRYREAHRILRERHRGEYLRILNELQGDTP